MPLYEYQCESCGCRFEVIQKFSEQLASECPTCGGPVHKLLSSPAIQFKGSGWYVTDYARKSNVEAEAGGDGSGEASKSSASGSTESSTGTGSSPPASGKTSAAGGGSSSK